MARRGDHARLTQNAQMPGQRRIASPGECTQLVKRTRVLRGRTDDGSSHRMRHRAKHIPLIPSCSIRSGHGSIFVENRKLVKPGKAWILRIFCSSAGGGGDESRCGSALHVGWQCRVRWRWRENWQSGAGERWLKLARGLIGQAAGRGGARPSIYRHAIDDDRRTNTCMFVIRRRPSTLVPSGSVSLGDRDRFLI